LATSRAILVGAMIFRHAVVFVILAATPELAYGVADWYEIGLYLPYAIDETGNFYSNGFKIRHLFVVPDAGLGCGMTKGSDRLLAKLIIGMDLN
jgi:hypothetical protein